MRATRSERGAGASHTIVVSDNKAHRDWKSETSENKQVHGANTGGMKLDVLGGESCS